MSVLIKGTEMPTVCDECWALDDNYDYPRCRITDEQRGYNFNCRERRMDRCPLVPVPGHGRLIDGDVAEVISYTDEQGDFADGILYAADWISEQPTIIPADKDGDSDG